jgi:predicted acylesterase/phospholipase RssA
MLFHLGALQRLNELRVLSRIDTVSSVSGGSITNALLAVHWNDLRENDFSKEAFDVLIRRPLLKFSEYNFAARILFHPKEIFKRLFKTKSTATSLADAYINAEKEVKRAVKTELQGWKNSDPARYEKNEHLLPLLDKCGFHEHLSEVLPDPKKEQSPLFIFCGCDVRSGGPIYFTKLRVSQQLYRPSTPIEETKYDIPEREASRLTDEISLAEAVAASSAHPFFAQPLKIDYKRGSRKNLVLSVMDGGVVDNLGLDPLLLPNDYNKTYDGIALPHMRVFISNAGAPVQEVDEPSVNIFNRLLRSLSLVGVQAERLRVRVLKENINTKRMYGAWWGLDDLWRYFYAHNFGRRNGLNGPAHGPDPSTDSGKVFGVPVAGNGQSSTKLASESTSESASDSDELATVQETTVRKSSELKGQKLADLANYLRSDTDFERIFTSTNPPHKMKDVLREVTTFRTDLNYINPEVRSNFLSIH